MPDPEGINAAAASSDTGGAVLSSSSSVLTCEAVLSPPLHYIVDGNVGGETSEEHRLSYYQQQPAWHCSFSRDGTVLAVCYGAPDPCIRIWKQKEVIGGQQQQQQQTQKQAKPRAQAGGEQQQQSQPRCTEEQNKNTWELLTTLSGIQTRTIRSVAFAPINRPLTLASASFDGTVAIWMQQTTPQSSAVNDDWDCIAQLEGHDNEVKSVAWNSTASLLATSGRDKTVWIWECFLPGTVGGPSVSDDHADGDFECIAVLHGHDADVKCVQFAASHGLFGDGDDIALSASYDNTVRIWAEDAGDWYCAMSIDTVHSSTVWTLTVAPSGTRFVSGSADGSLAIYKCYSADELRKIQSDDENDDDNDHGRPTASTSNISTKSTWKCVGKLPQAHASTVYSVDYAPSRAGHGRLASGGADNRLQIYREAMGSTSEKPRFLLDAAASVPGGDVNCVRWHPWDGSVLVSAGDDGNTRIWRYKAF